MKMATADVVFPSIFSDAERGSGISQPRSPIREPRRMERIRGFLEKFLSTSRQPFQREVESSLRSSRTVIHIPTLRGEIEATARIERCSASDVGMAKVMKGIPKNATLPKTVLTMSR